MALVWTPLIASPRDVGPSMLQCPGGIQRPEQSKVSEKKACCTKRIQKVGPKGGSSISAIDVEPPVRDMKANE